jgi:hypothetical protein
MNKDRLGRLEDKLDKISDKLSEMNVILAENTQSLIIHEKRTDLAEKKIGLVEVRLEEQLRKDGAILEKIEDQLLPIKNHVAMVSFLFKYIIPSIAAILVFLHRISILKF